MRRRPDLSHQAYEATKLADSLPPAEIAPDMHAGMRELDDIRPRLESARTVDEFSAAYAPPEIKANDSTERGRHRQAVRRYDREHCA